MASFDFCIDQNKKLGRIDKDMAELLKGADDPESELNRMVGSLTRQKREAAVQSLRMAKAFEAMEANPGGLYNGLMSLMARDLKGKAKNTNVEAQARFYTAKFHSRFADALSRFRTRRLGFEQDKAGLEKLTDAIYGIKTDDAEINKFADDWLKLTEEVRQTFNLKGGSIPKNEKWLLPQNHDAVAVEKVPTEEWKNFIRPLLDRDQMLDELGAPLDDAQFEDALDAVYETITKRGLNKVQDFAIPRLGQKLSRKGSERRFLYFKDSESWRGYQDRFGKGDIFTTLTDFVDTKAHDIALLEMFGPSPDDTFKALRGQVEKKQKLTGRQGAFMTSLWNVTSGRTNDGEMTGMADFMQTVRNLITASTLGKAFLSAISDTGFQAMTARYNGIPAFRALSRQLSLMNPAKESDRIFAVKMGLIAENWVDRAHGGNRYVDIHGTGISAKLAEGVLRGSLLSPWTDAGRKGFGMEYSSMLADNFSKTIDELDFPVKRAFEAYDINADDWNTFRKQKPLTHKGAKFADMLQEGGEKFHRMVLTETDFAVPTPDANVRAITTGGLGRSTIPGQAWRSAMMLKSFPITLATTHFYRAAMQSTTQGKIAYSTMLAASTSVLGGIALQAKDISAGREPRPVDAKFFAAAFQQGGGLGIFGDFLFSDVNRFGGGITQTIFGPTGELIDTTVKFTLGNIREAVLMEETNILGESAQILKRYTPDTWQTQVFTDALFDQIEMLGNPDAQRRFNRIMRRRDANYDQGYWWRPGEPLPEFAQ